ncbi:hypothetical protein [Streptomyces sp. 351MFTsu5.1]|uniref:hypothetical protein n=1 Tax=Streptomyces sp. 351MFTsu5.1 TaxID=1172180 RepID=UPI001319ECC6|nr:hypothetical protein [Streptomyces sp. 351MFTsu5.1]
MQVERVQGEYRDPEIIDLEDGTGCLFKIHESDISEDGTKMLADLLTEQAQRWAPRPADEVGPVIPVHWDCVPDLPEPFAIGVDDGPDAIIYTVDSSILSQRAGDYLGRLDTERSPHWQRVPKGYHDDVK